MDATAMPPPVSRIPRSSLPAMPAAIVVLTTAAVLLGSRPWATPERVLGGWQVADRDRTPVSARRRTSMT